jgi:hypothetical protein
MHATQQHITARRPLLSAAAQKIAMTYPIRARQASYNQDLHCAYDAVRHPSPLVPSSDHDISWLHIVHRLLLCPACGWQHPVVNVFLISCC